MEYLKTISDYFGEQVAFPLDQEIHRFGAKSNLWAAGVEWEYKGNHYYCIKYGNWKAAGKPIFTLNSWANKELTRNESSSIRNKIQEMNIKVENEKQEKYKLARETWRPVYQNLRESNELHSYIEAKGLKSNYTARISDISNPDIHLYPNTLLIPVYNESGLTGVQRIFKDKDNNFHKRYCTGLELKGSISPINRFTNSELVYVAEGYATACTIHEATGKPAISCFQSGNILPAIQTIRRINPTCKIVICADRDLHEGEKHDKVGEKSAKYASQKTNDCIYKVVEFPEGSASNWSDFNDLACFVPNGLEHVKNQLTIDLDKFEEEEFKKDIQNGFTELNDKDKPVRKYHRLLEFFDNKHKYKYITDLRRVLIWTGTHYAFIEDQDVKSFAQSYFNYPRCEMDKQRTEFLNLVKASNITSSEFLEYKNIKGLINFKNGVYDYVNDKLLPHSSQYPFQYTLDVDYNPDAVCPIWDSLMENITVKRKHIQDALEEFLGFCISDMEYDKYNKALILDGGGSNGKSTIIRFMEKLVGRRNCSSVAVSEIGDNRFLVSTMENKLINFSEEEPRSIFAKTGTFKKLTGGSPLFSEMKGKQGKSIESRTKLVMTYNEMPILKDTSKGMLRRLMILPFDLDLETTPWLKISHITEKLEYEKEGVILRAIEGLKRLETQKGFTKIPESEQKIEEMIIESDAVMEWANDYLTFTDNEKDFVSLEKMFMSYNNFVGSTDRKASKIWFSKKLKSLFKSKKVKSERKLMRIEKASLRGFNYLKHDDLLDFN